MGGFGVAVLSVELAFESLIFGKEAGSDGVCDLGVLLSVSLVLPSSSTVSCSILAFGYWLSLPSLVMKRCRIGRK